MLLIRYFLRLELILFRILLKGDIVNDITYHLKAQSLIGDYVKHYPYEEGANMYVAKYICDEKVNWGIVENNS